MMPLTIDKKNHLVERKICASIIKIITFIILAFILKYKIITILNGSHGIELTRDLTQFLRIGFVVGRNVFLFISIITSSVFNYKKEEITLKHTVRFNTFF